MDEIVPSDVRGRHASADSMVFDGTSLIRNLDTRVTPETTELKLMSVHEGVVCLRFDDKKRHDFWLEFNLDRQTLEKLLAMAKESEKAPA